MKNRYITIIGLMQICAIISTVLLATAISRAANRMWDAYGLSKMPKPTGLIAAEAYSLFGVSLFLPALAWVAFSVFSEGDKFEFSISSSALAGSGLAIFTLILILGLWSSLSALSITVPI